VSQEVISRVTARAPGATALAVAEVAAVAGLLVAELVAGCAELAALLTEDETGAMATLTLALEEPVVLTVAPPPQAASSPRPGSARACAVPRSSRRRLSNEEA